MGHDHHGHAAGREGDRSRLRWVLLITGTVMLVELVGAWVTGSLALLADAGHMATDAAAVVLALSASYVATLRPGPRSTFGFHRAEIIAAAVNGLVLFGVCGYLLWVGAARLFSPDDVAAVPMIGFAVVGLVANGVSLLVLHRSHTGSLNLRGALNEVLADLIGSVLAIAAGVVIWTTGFLRADAIASLLIAVLIVPRALVLLRDALTVLLEGTPADLDIAEVRDHLASVEGVQEVHDLHAWTITSGLHSLSAHVTVSEEQLAARGVGPIIDDLSRCAEQHFSISHTTFQVEPPVHREHEDLGTLGESACD